MLPFRLLLKEVDFNDTFGIRNNCTWGKLDLVFLHHGIFAFPRRCNLLAHLSVLGEVLGGKHHLSIEVSTLYEVNFSAALKKRAIFFLSFPRPIVLLVLPFRLLLREVDFSDTFGIRNNCTWRKRDLVFLRHGIFAFLRPCF